MQGVLHVGQVVWVQTAVIEDERHGGITGTVLDVSPSTLRMLVGGHPRDLPASDVLVVSERHSAVRKGVGIGLAIGGGLGLWALAANCRQADISPESCDFAQLFGAIAIVSGMAIGGEVGRALQSERVLFLAPDLRPHSGGRARVVVGRSHVGVRATFPF